MGYELFLPKNIEQREKVLNAVISAGERHRHPHEVGWWLAHHYLQGCRDFTNINYSAGTLDVNYIDQDGVLRFRYDDVVSKFQSQVGRLLQIDLAPRVERKSIGLEDLRKASIAQIILDAVFPPGKVADLRLKLFPPLAKYGAIGLVVWNEGEDIGIDIVPPWELVPIPPHPLEEGDVKGIARIRMVPLDWVQQLSDTPDAGAKVYEEMEKTRIPVGMVPTGTAGRFSVFGETISGESGTLQKGFGSKQTDKTYVDIVKFVEVWTKTNMGYLARYEMMAGKKHLFGRDFSKKHMYMPINKCNDIKTGGFWGRSFVSVQIPLNTEMEYTLGSLFQYVQDIDAYGILCLPTTLGIPAAITRGTDGTKRIMYEPDYTSPDLKPFTLSPVKTGNFPVEVLKMGSVFADKLANQPAAMMKGDAPGRVDSQTGLGFLYEISNTPLAPTATDVANAMSNCYKAILDLVGAGVWPREKLIQVSMLDDTLAGVVLDPTEGTVSLATNIVPRPDEVNISVQSMLPRSKQQEKVELASSLAQGVIDLFEYRIAVRKKGLDIPVGNEPEWQNYRRAMMENIILFGDGRSPGEVIFDVSDMHEVHIRVLQAFMARPEFYQAAVEVREAFKQHYQAHLEMMANVPDQVPYNEELAEEAQLTERGSRI